VFKLIPVMFALGYCGVRCCTSNTIGCVDNTLVIAIPPVAAMAPLSVIRYYRCYRYIVVTVAQVLV
jgi:hypothetical protein